MACFQEETNKCFERKVEVSGQDSTPKEGLMIGRFGMVDLLRFPKEREKS